MSRRRGPYIALALFVLAAGLLTRPARRVFPGPLPDALGDMLWALLIYLLLALLRPSWPARRIFAAVLAFSVAIEVSQLYHAPWIDAIRRTTPGALVLGWGFAWTDLLCYAAGCAVGWTADRALLARSAGRRSIQ
jgi:hypothetical protein